MIEKLIFPLPPSLNKIIASARSNPYKSAAEKKAWTEDCEAICWGKTQFHSKVWLEVYWYLKRQIDPADNLPATLKPILDGMVRAEIIVDDSMKIIQPPIITWFEVHKGESYVKVLVSDVPIYRGIPTKLYQLESTNLISNC